MLETHGSSNDNKSKSEVWLENIRLCGSVVHHRHRGGELVQESIDYLENLSHRLDQLKEEWDQPPLTFPPDVPPSLLKFFSSTHTKNGTNGTIDMNKNTYAGVTNNIYSQFENGDNDDEEDSMREEIVYTAMDNSRHNNNGNNLKKEDNHHHETGIVMRRLMIRVLTSVSEVLSYKASQLGRERPPQWLLGAESYQLSFAAVNRALFLADEEYAKLHAADMNHDENDNNHRSSNNQQRTDLSQDAQTVGVTIAHFASDRDKYAVAAKNRMKHLQKLLLPQWDARDEVKRTMGSRWKSNPNPKNNFARLRMESENELIDLKSTINALLLLDTVQVYERSQTIYQHMSTTTTATTMNSNTGNSRYNFARPNYQQEQHERVPYSDYPDPAGYGWTFTGSNEQSRVEFFEMAADHDSIVKLDFFYTTGTVKTSMHHPTQGQTQLFGNGTDMTSHIYIGILRDPRAHTDVRYHSTASRN